MNIINELKYLKGVSDLYFSNLLEMINDESIPIRNAKLKNAYAITTFDCIYYDFDAITSHEFYGDEFLYYVMLHEICHYKRIKKFGNEKFITGLTSNSLTEYFDFLINEEIISDRWASYIFYKLNGRLLRNHMTQNLHIEENKNKFMVSNVRSFNIISGDMKNYDELVNHHIIETYE